MARRLAANPAGEVFRVPILLQIDTCCDVVSGPARSAAARKLRTARLRLKPKARVQNPEAFRARARFQSWLLAFAFFDRPRPLTGSPAHHTAPAGSPRRSAPAR